MNDLTEKIKELLMAHLSRSPDNWIAELVAQQLAPEIEKLMPRWIPLDEITERADGMNISRPQIESHCVLNGHMFNGTYYCITCGIARHNAKPPDQKKEKPMSNLEINTQLFDGLSLHHRIRAILELSSALKELSSERIELQMLAVKNNEEFNGTYCALYVHERAIKNILDHLFDSTVEKFGGLESPACK